MLKARSISLSLVAFIALSSSLAACSGPSVGQNGTNNNYRGSYGESDTTPLSQGSGQPTPSPQQGAPVINEGEVQQAQANHAIKAMVTITTRVKKMLPEDTKGRQHEKFLLGLSDGSTVLVAHSTDSAPYVPLQAGDIVTIHGEYIWNAKGGLIHWTHHTDSPRHEGGWIDFNGQRYQ